VREVEAKEVQHLVIDNEHFSVVSNEVVGSTGDGDALGEETHFESTQVFLLALVCMGDEGLDGYAATDCLQKSLFDLNAIETKDENADTFFGFSQRLNKGFDAIVRLNEELHSISPLNAATDTY